MLVEYTKHKNIFYEIFGVGQLDNIQGCLIFLNRHKVKKKLRGKSLVDCVLDTIFIYVLVHFFFKMAFNMVTNMVFVVYGVKEHRIIPNSYT